MADMVNHPPHYGGDWTYEPVKVTEAWELNHRLSSCVEYILRHEHKGEPLRDLEKALWWLSREVAERKAETKRKRKEKP